MILNFYKLRQNFKSYLKLLRNFRNHPKLLKSCLKFSEIISKLCKVLKITTNIFPNDIKFKLFKKHQPNLKTLQLHKKAPFHNKYSIAKLKNNNLLKFPASIAKPNFPQCLTQIIIKQSISNYIR